MRRRAKLTPRKRGVEWLRWIRTIEKPARGRRRPHNGARGIAMGEMTRERAERFLASCPSGQGPGSKPEDVGSIPTEATTMREDTMHG